MSELGAPLLDVESPMQGTAVAVSVAVGDTVRAGQTVVLLESMKMLHDVKVVAGGTVREVLVVTGATVAPGQVLCVVAVSESAGSEAVVDDAIDLDAVRADLADVVARHEIGLDAARPEAVAKRRRVGRRTARENVADLVDPGSFVEYGPLAIAAQRRRRAVDDLVANTPADGMIGGIGTVSGDRFGGHAGRSSRCPTTTPSSPGRRGCRTIARRTACSRSPASSASPSCSSPRAAAGGPATPTAWA